MKKFDNKTEGLLNWLDLKKGRNCALYWGMFAVLLVISLACIVPILWVALSGFKSVDELYSIPPSLLPKSIDLQMAISAWNKASMNSAFATTFWVIVGAWCFDVVINGITGYALSKVKPLGSALLNTLIFWSMMLPGISMVPLYVTFCNFTPLHLNMVGSYVPLWMMAGANAFNVFLFRTAFNGIPDSYVEAAKLDGGTDMKVFTRIMLPLTKPVVVVVSIFSIMGSWGSFMWPYLLLSNTGRDTIGVRLYKMTSGAMVMMDNEKMLVLTMSIIIPLLIYMFFSKKIIGGLDMSGIKG